jgi:hypothetical protein
MPQRPIEEVGAERQHHTNGRRRLGHGDRQGTEEEVAIGVVDIGREQLLELIDDE